MPNSNTNQTLKSLEELYLDGKYEAITDSLLEMRSELPRGLFHFNLGTVYAKKENFAVGRYHLEKAISEGYLTTGSLNNLQVVRQKLAISDISDSQELTDVALNKGISTPFSAYLFVTLLLIAFIGFFKLWKNWFTEWKKMALGFFISILPIAVGSYIHQYDFAVALQEAEVYEGPSGVYEQKSLLPGGAKVIIGKFYNGWYFVEKPDGLRGWVKKEAIGIL